ncbi:MAG: UDP-4-amino-4,6-dideoxy-N-acetyl-beta-L-altrosamine transaminase [Candidatus Woesearchaeota archaeon]|nr:MAG: UDP-4-amino-4,6-dideoxy-N-acetyl-beta-L-altrosamine transaminase [Candidatus Woesearchaeota archaeon]
MRKIPYFKPDIEEEEINEVVDTLKSGWITTGPKTKKFEEEFSKYTNSKYSIAVNSCTAALHIALDSIGIKKGDEIITSPFTFAATGEVICYFDAKPVFVDIKEDTYNIDPKKIEAKITSKTRAIIPVHYGGQPCDMDEIMAIAKKHNLKVIEDAAHAIGAEYKGKKIGNVGDITAFSFYATKNMTTGEGGMVTTNDKEYAKKMNILRLHGISKDAWKRYSDEGSWYYEILDKGYKYNMSDIQAALGLSQLKKLGDLNKKRGKLAAIYNESFSKIPEIKLRKIKDEVGNIYHLYTIWLNTSNLKINRNEFIEELKRRSISTSVHFIPLHIHPYYKKTFNYCVGDFPIAEKIYENIISLPLYPSMTKADIEYVIDAVGEIISIDRK